MSNFNVLKVLTLFEVFAVGGHTVEACLPHKKGGWEVKIVSVVRLWEDTGGRGEWGRGERVTFQVGVELGLEAVQGVSCHDLLRQTVPVWYSSREERHLPVLCPAGRDVIAVVVVVRLQ